MSTRMSSDPIIARDLGDVRCQNKRCLNQWVWARVASAARTASFKRVAAILRALNLHSSSRHFVQGRLPKYSCP